MKQLLVFLAVALTSAAPAPKSQPWVQGWEKPVNPTGKARFQREGESLTVSVPGMGHEFDVVHNRLSAPHLLREVEGDFIFQVRVRVPADPPGKKGYHRAGVLFHDGKWAAKMHVGVYLDAKQKTWRCFLSNQQFGEGGGLTLLGVDPPIEQTAHLRFERRGDYVRPAFSLDGKKWHDPIFGGQFLAAKAVKVGVLVESTGEDEFKAVFDQLELTQPKE